MKVKANLKELRLRKGLTQFQLASETDLSLSMIQGIENNRAKSITFSTLEKMCTVLGCGPGELFKTEEN